MLDNSAALARHPVQRLMDAVPALIPSILMLNIADAIYTLGYVQSGLAVEDNPLMADLLAHSPLAFVLGKLGLVCLGLFLLWRKRHQPLASCGLVVLFMVYYGILMVHLGGQQISAETAATLWR